MLLSEKIFSKSNQTYLHEYLTSTLVIIMKLHIKKKESEMK